MTHDLVQYQSVIEQLKPFVKKPDFNKALEKIAADIPKPKRFLIKMELMRLARPCTRIIDLRNKLSTQCDKHEHHGITHFLDKTAKGVFESEMTIWGEYTLGVYEAVMTSEKRVRMKQKLQSSASTADTSVASLTANPTKSNSKYDVDYSIPVYCFWSFRRRSEERMNFAINLDMFGYDKQSFQVVSKDISVNGLQVKADLQYQFQKDAVYLVFFRGLETEFYLDKNNGVPYEVIHIKRSEEEQLIGLRRIDDPRHDNFVSFLEQFIRCNKRRYKVNIDNVLQTTQKKGYEQYYISSFASVPVYIEQRGNNYTPSFVLSNDCNCSSIDYWRDENNQLCLHNILNSSRLSQAIDNQITEFYVYSFCNVSNEKVFFYSASDVELASNVPLRKAFQGFGSRKASWRVFKIQLATASAEDSFIPLSLPGDISNRDSIKKYNPPPTPRVMAKLKYISHIAVMADITEPISTLSYQQYAVHKTHLATIKTFGHGRRALAEPTAVTYFRQKNVRSDNRFLLRTPVVISYRGENFAGITENVSPIALRLELTSPFKGDGYGTVSVALPRLQAETEEFVLNNLRYEVRHISKDGRVLHLKIYQGEQTPETHVAYQFFKDFHHKNQAALNRDTQEDQLPRAGKALRNIYINNPQNITFYLKRWGPSNAPAAMALPRAQSALVSLFAELPEPLNHRSIYPVFATEGEDQDFIADKLKHMSAHTVPIARELYLSYDLNARNTREAVSGKFLDRFTSDQEQKDFAERAISAGVFYAIRLYLARTGQPDLESMTAEMSYIKVYAQYKAKNLQESLWQITGVCEMLDVTDETMRRLGISADQIATNADHLLELSKVTQITETAAH